MKVFIEADSIANRKMSGIGHATLEIIRAVSKQLDDTEHSVVVIVPFGKKSLLDKYRFENIKVRTLPPGYKYVNYALARTSLPIPVDIFFGRGVYIFPNYKTWYVPFSKSAMFLHDVAYKLYPATTHPKNLVYLQANMTRWLRRATWVVTISKSSQKDILHFFPSVKSKLNVIYLGVDKAVYYKRTKAEIDAVKAKYGVDKDYFLYVGNIEPRKNITALVEGYKLYCDAAKIPAQLVLVGGGSWRDSVIKKKIQSLVERGYNIHRPEKYVEDEDLPALFSGAVALTHMSLHEGYGLSLVQAQACGTPVVASNLAVFKETLQGDMVIYVSPRNHKDIAAAMSEVQLIGANKAKIEIKHTWTSTAKQLIDLTGIIKSIDE